MASGVGRRARCVQNVYGSTGSRATDAVRENVKPELKLKLEMRRSSAVVVAAAVAGGGEGKGS